MFGIKLLLEHCKDMQHCNWLEDEKSMCGEKNDGDETQEMHLPLKDETMGEDWLLPASPSTGEKRSGETERSMNCLS